MTTDTPTPATEVTASDELRLLGQILTRVDKLSPASKAWLRQRLDADARTDDRSTTT